MASYSPDSTVEVRPFAHSLEGTDVIIGDNERQVFLCIPADGLDILESLAAGNTVAETVRRYQEKYGETPDIEDFLEVLGEEGFVAPADGEANTVAREAHVAAHPGPAQHNHGFYGRSFSLDWISPRVARHLCGPVVVSLCLAILLLGVVLVLKDPVLIPGAVVLLFPHGHFALLTLFVLIGAVVALLVHEFAHAIVARAAGASTRLGIGNLMYVMVAQTDISQMWLAPKRRRYVAYVAGTFTDCVCTAIVVTLLSANRHGLIHLSVDWWEPFLSATLLTYMFRIFFQFFFYIRTDVYYVIAAVTNSKNLMSDTEDLLRNRVARLFGRTKEDLDQSHIPPREQTVIRRFAWLYVIGRAFALAVLFFYYVPLLLGYAWQFVLLVTGQPHRFHLADYVVAAGTAFIIDGGGITLWIRSIRRDQRERRLARHTARAQASQARSLVGDDPDALLQPIV